MTSIDPASIPAPNGTPDPLIAPHVTAEQATTLTAAVDGLHQAVDRRSAGFLVALILIAAVGLAVAVLGWRSEHFLTCQAQRNMEFRNAAATERAAQRHLFDVILNPASTPEQRVQASREYRAGLDVADQQRSDSTTAARDC